MSGFFTGILKICLLLSVPVSGQDVNEERIDQSLPFNKSLLIYNEASENLENATRTIADLNEAMKETTKLKNEVNSSLSLYFLIKRKKMSKIERVNKQQVQSRGTRASLIISELCELFFPDSGFYLLKTSNDFSLLTGRVSVAVLDDGQQSV